MHARRGFATALLLSPLVAIAPAAWAQTQALGKLYGDIGFSGVTAALSTYLGANLANSASGGVHAYLPGTWVAETGYTASNTAVSTTQWRVATYDIHPPVSATGSQFYLVANIPLNGGYYRFGYHIPGTLASYQSAVVMPETTLPAGTRLDVSECAAFATATLTFSGAVAALGAGPMSCSVAANVEETPGSGGFNSQARSKMVSRTLAAWQATPTISFPVRANGSAVKFSASCSIAPPAGSNFQVNDAGNAGFEAETATAMVVACGATPAPAIDIPVQPNAGSIAGRFDLSGFVESRWQVAAVPTASGAPRRTAGATTASNQPNPAAWQIGGIVAGPVVVGASATVQGGNLFIELPHTEPPNTLPSVPLNATLDLGSTFVVRPLQATGRLYLVDPRGQTRLSTLFNSAALPPGSSEGTSYMEAAGSNASVDSQAPRSAVGGLSRGRLNGSYSAGPGCLGIPGTCTALTYGLLFSGLSPISGALDGSTSRRTAWDIKSAHLEFRAATPYHQQQSSVSFTREMHYYSAPPDPLEIPRLAACVGQVELDLRVDAATGKLFAPFFATGDGVVTTPMTTLGSPDVASSYHTAYGAPQTQAQAGAAASVVATVPEGASYVLNPQVRFLPAAGTIATTLAGLPWVMLPGGGATLACGQVARACMKINDPAGNATPLSIVAGTLDACQATAGNTLPVSVVSNAVAVDSVSWSLDDGAQSGTSCTSCGADWSGSLALPPLTAGQHWLTITASSQNGCAAEVRVPICGAPPVVESKRRLAFFDGNTLRMVRLEDGIPIYDANPIGGAGPIRFNRTGTSLVVRSPNRLTTLDASSGAESGAQVGKFTAFEFRPGTDQDYAAVQWLSSDNGPYLLYTRVGGTVVAPQLIGPAIAGSGETLSQPMLTWSNNGSRLYAAYTRSSSTSNLLEVLEWTVSGTALGATPVRTQSTLVAGERLRALDIEAIGTRVIFASTRGIFTQNPDGSVLPWVPVPMNRADIGRNPTFAFEPLAANGMPLAASRVIMVSGSGSSMSWVQEPAAGPVYGLATSPYATELSHAVLAVARSSSTPLVGPRAMIIYRLANVGGSPSLVLDRALSATDPKFPAFRPHVP